MPPGLVIGRAGASDLGLLDQLATVGPVEARRRLVDAGAARMHVLTSALAR
jgi:hypothetical protein